MIKKDVIVVGAGPAGMAASIEAAKRGCKVTMFDSNPVAGGQLYKQIHKFFGSSAHKAGTRGIDIGAQMVKEAEDLGVEVVLNSSVIGLFEPMTVAVEIGTDPEHKYVETFEANQIVIASGASENVVRFDGWTKPGVMGAGAAQTMINVNRVLPGEKILMIGSGNVGLIVSYQLMQAGADVVGLVEAAPNIGGYWVHAAKITRAGVPILTKHTVFEALGDERVEGAIIGELDDKWQLVPGTEQEVECDTIAIGAGLKPLTELAMMYGCELMFDPGLGGWIPMHGRNMQTTKENIYIAGDVSSTEEANTALEEGRLAGISIAEKQGKVTSKEADEDRAAVWERLNGLREGSTGLKRRAAKERQIERFEERGNN